MVPLLSTYFVLYFHADQGLTGLATFHMISWWICLNSHFVFSCNFSNSTSVWRKFEFHPSSCECHLFKSAVWYSLENLTFKLFKYGRNLTEFDSVWLFYTLFSFLSFFASPFLLLNPNFLGLIHAHKMWVVTWNHGGHVGGGAGQWAVDWSGAAGCRSGEEDDMEGDTWGPSVY